MSRVGYARVSTRDQHPEAQEMRLLAEGCERVFTDSGVSGKLAARPQWDECLRYLRPGDALVAVKLDRIGRSMKNLAAVMEQLGERKIDLVILDQAIDTTTPGGRFVFHVFAAIAEFERDLIRERTMDGLAAARARGKVGGSRPKLTPAQRDRAQAMYDERDDSGRRRYTVEEIGNTFKVSRPTVYRALGGAQ
jgi:DNA invertase Pin-like site-specific DNA recombinase